MSSAPDRADILGVALRPTGEGGRAGNQNVRASLHRKAGGILVDATVDLKIDGLAQRVDALAQLTDFRQLAGDEALPAEAGVDRHHQNEIQILKDMLDGFHRRRRV